MKGFSGWALSFSSNSPSFCLASPLHASRIVALLAADLAQVRVVVLSKDVLPENAKVGLMGGQAKHDQVGVQAVDDVPGVGVVGWGAALGA